MAAAQTRGNDQQQLLAVQHIPGVIATPVSDLSDIMQAAMFYADQLDGHMERISHSRSKRIDGQQLQAMLQGTLQQRHHHHHHQHEQQGSAEGQHGCAQLHQQEAPDNQLLQHTRQQWVEPTAGRPATNKTVAQLLPQQMQHHNAGADTPELLKRLQQQVLLSLTAVEDGAPGSTVAANEWSDAAFGPLSSEVAPGSPAVLPTSLTAPAAVRQRLKAHQSWREF